MIHLKQISKVTELHNSQVQIERMLLHLLEIVSRDKESSFPNTQCQFPYQSQVV